MKAFGHMVTGDMPTSREESEKDFEVALDPFYSQFPNYTLGLAYFLGGHFQEEPCWFFLTAWNKN